MPKTQPTTQIIMQRVAAKALIVNDQGQVLLLREASTYQEGTHIGRYNLPGGRLNPGEAWLDGLQREVREETGLKITVQKPIFIGEWQPVIKGIPTQIIALFFACKPLTKRVTLSDEHDSYIWVQPADVSTLDIAPPVDAVIQAYLNDLH